MMSEYTTLTEYAAAIIELFSPDFDFPGSFESDAENCFWQRLTPEQAADKLARAYLLEKRVSQ